MSEALLSKLGDELHDWTRSVLARATESRFRRADDERGEIVTTLQPDPQQQVCAEEDSARLCRWQRTVTSVLRRRGCITAADAVDLLISDLGPFVQLARKDIADVTESTWRAAFARELTAISVRLTSILESEKEAFAIVEGRPTTAYDVFDIRIALIRGTRFRVEAEGSVRSLDLALQIPDSETLAGADLDWLVDYGRTLFRALFRGERLAAYERWREGAASRKRGLRIQLDLRNAPQLGAVPWELLHDGRRFLSLTRGTSIARYLGGSARRRPNTPVGPVRVLLTISTPRSMDWIDAGEESALLCGAVAPLVMLGRMEIDVAPDGSVATLHRMLRAADDRGRPYHVWHFIGHGEYDEGTAKSTLAMTNAERDVHRLGGWELGALFEEQTELRFVFLNACEGGCGQAGTPMSGAATALIEAGVPAVVAMQSPITDVAATLFADEVYGALTDGAVLDDAIVDGRRAMFFHSPVGEWATPVVFVREAQGDDELFHLSPRTRK